MEVLDWGDFVPLVTCVWSMWSANAWGRLPRRGQPPGAPACLAVMTFVTRRSGKPALDPWWSAAESGRCVLVDVGHQTPGDGG